MNSKARPNFTGLMLKFAEGQLSGRSFVRRFLALWRRERDSEAKRKAEWPQPFDAQLKTALLNGEIGKDEFSRRWGELWWPNSPEDRRFAEMIDRVFSACDAFDDEAPLPNGESGEDRLRKFVAGELNSHISRAVSSATG